MPNTSVESGVVGDSVGLSENLPPEVKAKVRKNPAVRKSQAKAQRSISFAEREESLLNRTITVLVKNAKGPSDRSASAARFNVLRSGMKVREALKRGYLRADLRYDQGENPPKGGPFIKLS